MAEIKSSGSSNLEIDSGAVQDFGPWTAAFMGVDQATHPITFDSSWMMLVVGTDTPGGIVLGRKHDIEIGVGPTSPPAEIIWGPMRYAWLNAGGGRGQSVNYSFPMILGAGDQLWVRHKWNGPGVFPLTIFITTTDQFQPVRPAILSFGTRQITALSTPGGVLFGGSNALGLWYIMGRDGTGAGMPLTFNSSWLSIAMGLIGVGTTKARFQLGASRDGNPPDLPEVIDIGFQSLGGGVGSQNAYIGDVMNFPVNWEKGDTVWVRGANILPTTARTFTMTANFWGNP